MDHKSWGNTITNFRNWAKIYEEDIYDEYLRRPEQKRLFSMFNDTTKEMKDFFDRRTRDHIARVKNNLSILADAGFIGHDEATVRGLNHDYTKYGDDLKEPYVWLTWFHRNGKDASIYPEGVEDEVEVATDKHVSSEPHHPEYYTNASEMSSDDIAEMVADWTAMSQELDSNIYEWVSKQKDKVAFTTAQWKIVDEMVDTIVEGAEMYSNKVGMLNITEAINKVVDEFGGNAVSVNAGMCEDVAMEIESIIPGAELTDAWAETGGEVDPLDSKFGGHIFIKYNNKYYDAENPEGVDDWRDLDFFVKGRFTEKRGAEMYRKADNGYVIVQEYLKGNEIWFRPDDKESRKIIKQIHGSPYFSEDDYDKILDALGEHGIGIEVRKTPETEAFFEQQMEKGGVADLPTPYQIEQIIGEESQETDMGGEAFVRKFKDRGKQWFQRVIQSLKGMGEMELVYLITSALGIYGLASKEVDMKLNLKAQGDGQIWIGDLAAYNEGRLVGRWIDVAEFDTASDLQDIINDEILEAGHEEFYVGDYSDFPNMGQYPDLDKVAAIARAMQEEDPEIVMAFVENIGPDYVDDALVDQINEAYQGTFNDLGDYAYELLSGQGTVSQLQEMGIEGYFDYDSYGRDLDLGGDIWTANVSDGVAIFWNV